MFGGEVGIKIGKIKLTRFSDNTYEMALIDKEGSHFHICGDNDMKTLLEEALNNIVEWKSIINQIKS